MNELSFEGEGGRGVTIRTDVSYLPEYYGASQYAGRTDVKAPKRKVGTVYDSQDLAAAVRKFATGPGAYLAASYAGREMVESEVFHVELKGQSLVIGGAQDSAAAPAVAPVTLTTAAPAAAAAPMPAPTDATAGAISATREMVGLVRELNQTAPAPTLEDIDRRLDAKLEKFAEKLKPATQPATSERPRTLVEQAKEIKEAAAVLGIGQPSTQPEQTQNPFDTYRTVKEQMRELAEEFAPQTEGQGLVGKVLGLFETTMKTVDRTLASPAGQKLAGVVISRFVQGPQSAPGASPVPPGTQPQQSGDGAPQGQQTQQQPEQQQLPAGLVSAARALAKEVTRDDVDKGADIVQSLFKSDPALVFELQGLFSMPSVALVEWLASVTGMAYLNDLPHGISYFDSLKEVLNERSQGEQSDEDEGDGAEVPAASNGHRARGADAPTI